MPTKYTITRANDASYDFTIGLDAAFAVATTIRWEIVPTEGEFPSAHFSGTIDFDTTQTTQAVTTGIIRNHIFPRDFEIRLYDDADNTNTPLATSDAQSIAGDETLVGGNLVFAGGNDNNVLGLGFTDDVGSVTGGAGSDVLVITRFQYGDVSITETDALIKFDFGVTITDYAERSVTSRGSTSILRVTLTLDTGAEIEITSPAHEGYSYQLGDSAVLDYDAFKTAINATGTNDDSQLGPDSDYTYTIANPTPAPFVDDAPFSFGLSSYIFGVESGSTTISTLTAIDSTSLMPVRYSIASGGDSALFSIDETTGVLSLVNALDYATTAQKRYTLTVNAHADGDTVSTQVVVYLLEVGGDVSAATGRLTFVGGSNDDIFVAASDNNLNATGGAGSDILVITRFQYGTVSINETDALIKFDYEVTITDYAERSVSSRGSTSILRATLTLDTGAEIIITSPAHEGYGYQLGDDAVLDYDAFKTAIKATGTNETSDLAGDYTVPSPTTSLFNITGDTLSRDVDENVSHTDELFKFKAVLKSDANADVTYSFAEGGNPGDVFRFEKNANGEFVLYLVSGKNLDYEDPNIANFYELTVQLSASGVEPETVPITITVDDVNDEVPVLADVGGVRAAAIVENVEGADAGDISFTVTDADAGSSFTADSFTISHGAGTSSDTAEKFEIVRNGNNWDLKVLTTDDNGDPVSLDYETDGTSGTINLNVRVSDGDNDSVEVIPITITLTNLNDNNPVLSTQVAWESTYATEVSENTPSGTHLFSVVGTDADNPPSLSYRIISINDETYDQNTSLFAIDAGNGMVGLQSNLDFETTESYDFVIQVFDEDNKASNEVEVTVTVADANDNAPTLTPSATTATLTEQTSLNARAADVATLTVADVDSVGGGTIMASDFVVYKGATGTTTDNRFEVVDVGGTWTLRLKANAGLDYEEENSDSDPTFMVRVGVNDGTNTPIPSAPITITVGNANEPGTIEITRNPIAKTLTATLTDQDGILTAADSAIDPSYEWFDVATGEKVSTDATFTYTDDNAHYRVSINYQDNFGTYTLTDSIGPLPFYFYNNDGTAAENDAAKQAFLILVALNDGSIIAPADMEAVFVTEDGTTATTHKGLTISTKNLAFGSIGLGTASPWGLNYEALTPDDQENGISVVIRATHDGTSIDFNFRAEVVDRPESVIFDDGVGEVDYTDYLKTVKLLDGEAYTTTDTIHTAAAAATGGGAITYMLSDTDAPLFDIDATSGVVTFKADTTLDASTKDSYQFEVVATETGTNNIERQTVSIDVKSILFKSSTPTSDTDTSSTLDFLIDTLGNGRMGLFDLQTSSTSSVDISGSGTATYTLTGGADKDLFVIRTANQGSARKTTFELDFLAPNFVKKSKYEVEITATDSRTGDADVLMYTYSVTGYPETPPVVKVEGGEGASADNPIDIDENVEKDLLTFTVDDPDRDYAMSDLSIVDHDGMADARFVLSWDEATQMGTLRTATGGFDYEAIPMPVFGTDRFARIFIKVADANEGSIASGDTAQVVVRVADVNETTINLIDGKEYTTTDTIYTATTEIGGTITYTLGGADANLFNIDSTSGAITFKADTTLDDDTTSSYEIEVTATESGTTNTERQHIAFDVSSIVFSTPLDEEFTQFESNIDGLVAGNFASVSLRTALDYETTGTSTRPTAAVTGGADMDVFEVEVSTKTSTTGQVNIKLLANGLVKKHQYEVEITITHPTTEETDVRAITLVVVNSGKNPIAPITAPAPPPITPDRTEEAHDPIDPDDPLAGIVPLPDTDPNG